MRKLPLPRLLKNEGEKCKGVPCEFDHCSLNITLKLCGYCEPMIIVDDNKMAWQRGMTLEQLLAGLGESQYVAVVRLNGKLVSRPHFGYTHVPDKAVIDLIPLIVGG